MYDIAMAGASLDFADKLTSPGPAPSGWFARKEIGYDNFNANQEGCQK
jgi:hypothetical protein